MRNMIQTKGYKMLAFLLAALLVIAFWTPLRTYADTSDAFHIKISYNVENDNDDDKNTIRVYYWTPTSEGYEFNGDYKEFTKIAQKTGEDVKEVDLPGPPQSVDVQVHGSTTDKSKYYMTKVELEVKDVVDGSGEPDMRTLWSGKLGCEIATFTSDTIYNKLIFNSPDGGIFPSFHGWRDPGSDREENNLGSDKMEQTDEYDTAGCKNPEAEGLAGFDIGNLSDVYAPTDNSHNEYEFTLTQGTVYDQFGAMWPDQSKGISIYFDPDNKGFETYQKNDDNYVLIVKPTSNGKDDYKLTITESKSWKECSRTINVHTFDYNITFKDEHGNVIETMLVDYGDTITAPETEADTISNYIWTCDEYADWTNTTDGPQERVVYRTILTGTGTKDDPSLISSVEDWESLQYMTEQMKTGGKYYRLANDITVTETIGTSDRRFEGHFDGNGKTLTINYVNDNNDLRLAPFSYINNATIENLIVDGTITGTSNQTAGLVGENKGTSYIDNCLVKASIEGGEYIGGFVVKAADTLTIKNSMFEGKINGTENCGGFVANGGANLIVRNCALNARDGSAIQSGATFVNGEFSKIIDCVYNVVLGTPQGFAYGRSKLNEKAVEKYQKEVTSAKNLTVTNFKVASKKAGKAVVSWTENLKADGYQIQYSPDKEFKESVKSVKIDKSNVKLLLENLKSAKKWYVHIRAYKKIKNPASGKKTTVYGKWSKVRSFKAKSDISSWKVEGVKNLTYTGKALKQSDVLVSNDGEYADVKVKYKNNVDVGTATMTITGTGDYTGTITKTFRILQAKNSITKVTTSKNISLNQLNKKSQSFTIGATAKENAKLSFKLKSVPSKAKKCISVSKAGKVTVKTGLAKGTYKIQVQITAAKTKNYKKTSVTKTVKVIVK